MDFIEEKIKNWLDLYNEYLSDQFEYPDEAKIEYSTFLSEKKEILKCFSLPNRKLYSSILFQLIDDNLYEKKIAENLFQLSINNSSKLSKQIIATMKKLAEVKPYLFKMDILFKDLYAKFEKSTPVKREHLPKYGGIYVFYDKGQPIYVGRANHIRNRIQWHTRKSSGSESATFAFNLAKMEYEKNSDVKKKRKELMDIEEFLEIFNKHKVNLLTLEFRCIEIENDILQTMFEPYLAYKLGTYPINNTFENH